jgi:transposase
MLRLQYKFVDIEEVRTFISQSVGEHSYYLIEEDEQGFSITRDNKAVSKTLKRFGVFILLSNQEMDKNQILKLYKEKDSVEKIFDTLKNSLKEKRLRVHSEDTLNGKMFVLFISLIIYTYMINQVKKNKTISKYSIPQVFKELDKIRLIILTDGTKHFSELSKKQKDILKAFDLKIPNSL